MSKRKSVKENYLYNLLFQILSLILPFVTTPYVSRVLQAENVGIYSYTYSIVSTFILFGSLGTAVYGQREIAIAGDDKEKVSRLFWEIFALKSIIMSVATVVFFIIAFNSRQYGSAFIAQIPFFLGAILDISWLYQGIEDFKYVAIRNSIFKFISLGLIFLLVKQPSDLIKYLLIMSCSQVIGNIPMWIRLKKEVFLARVSLKNILYHIRYTFIYFVPAIATQIYSVLDKTMLGLIGGIEAENGYYEQAHKIVNMTISLVSSYTIVMRSRISYLFGREENIQKIRNEIASTLRFICFLVFPMAFGLAGIAKNFVPWFFGADYDKVVILLYVFSPMYVFLGIDTCLGTNILLPIGKQGKSSLGQIVGAILNIILNAILIPRLYSIGASIASVMTEFVIFMILLHYSKEYVSSRDLLKMSIKYFLSAAGMFGVIWSISKNLAPSIMNTFTLIAIGGTVYIFILVVFKDKIATGILDTVVKKIKNLK